MLRDLFSLFPAYAGVILMPYARNGSAFTFPRIRGGDPFIGDFYFMCKTFSPHTRG